MQLPGGFSKQLSGHLLPMRWAGGGDWVDKTAVGFLPGSNLSWSEAGCLAPRVMAR